MNGSNPEDILYTANGKLQNPINLDNFLIITKIVCSTIGIPMNVFIAITIIRRRRLHSKPRNIFLLALIFSNLLAFVPAVIELIYWILPNDVVCEAYVAIVGLPYALLLLNMLLALVDRYVAITHPLWHRKKFTVRRAAGLLILSSLCLTFLLKFVYISGIAPLSCEIRFVHGKVVGWVMVVLLISCIILHFIVYRHTKILLQRSQGISPPRKETLKADDNRNPNLEQYVGGDNIELIELPNNTCLKASTTIRVIKDHSVCRPIPIHVSGGTLCQMEMDATRTLIEGVASLFVMTFPLILFFLALFFCRLYGKFDCSNISWLAPYFKETGLLHAVYNPFLYVFRNKELWSIMKEKWPITLQCIKISSMQ